MMIESSYSLCAHWGPRREPAGECARKTLRLIGELEKVSDVWANWFEKADSKQDALSKPLRLEDRDLERLFVSGQHFRDDPLNEVISDLGFQIGIWNGGEGDAASSLSMSCGCWSTWVKNAIVLKVPAPVLTGTPEKTTEILGRVVGAFISIFDPDWLWLDSEALRQELGIYDFDPPLPRIPGWITYVAPRQGVMLPGIVFSSIDLPLPVPASCVIAGAPPFSVDDQAKVDAVKRVLDAVRNKGAVSNIGR